MLIILIILYIISKNASNLFLIPLLAIIFILSLNDFAFELTISDERTDGKKVTAIARETGATLRFEEDPVRMLRALKLVGQFNFAMDDATENALFDSLPLIRHAATSRLSLELEKILVCLFFTQSLPLIIR